MADSLDHATVQFFLHAPDITLVPLTRSSDGYCEHPAVPWDQLDEYPVRPFFAAWGYDFAGLKMTDDLDDDHPLMVSYLDGGSIAGWEPFPPEGDGWILIAIGSGEESPYAWWVRKGQFRRAARG